MEKSLQYKHDGRSRSGQLVITGEYQEEAYTGGDDLRSLSTHTIIDKSCIIMPYKLYGY